MSDQQLFRSAMARLSTAVSVIASDGIAGRYGMTASAVCSVSDHPPTLLVCINRSARANAVIKANAAVSVNVLAAEQTDLSRRFADGALDQTQRFGPDQDWTRIATGAPVLASALAAFDCRVTQIEEVGSHSVFFCAVAAIRLGALREGLVYFDRQYRGTVAPVSAEASA